MTSALLVLAQTGFAASSDEVDPLANPPSPAFDGQTRAPAATTTVINVEVLATDLVLPRSLVMMPDGDLLMVNGAGEARVLTTDGELGAPITGMPEARTAGGRGFADLVLDANFADNRMVYMSYPSPDGTPKVTRARLSQDKSRLENVEEIADIGARRLVSAPDGTLFITTQGYQNLYEVQDLGTLSGKMLRINNDGSIPADNPFVNVRGARPEVYAVGHRDPDGAIFDSLTGQLWTIEHGPMGGDELNSIQKGENNGWPAISYGKNYDGTEVGGSIGAGLQQPLYYWFPSVAPSGLMRYSGSLFPQWKDNLLLGTMSPTQGKFLVRLVMDGEKVVAIEHLLVENDRRVRAVTQGSDGAVYVLTDSENNDDTNRHFPGQVLKLTPR
jgi:glucose/arabinose dehydrogenase